MDGRPVPGIREPAATVVFINGFHRSGTTLLTAAVTEATGGVTLTVRDLARHLPVLRYFLRVQRRNNRTPDRGADSLAVTESTPEERPAADRHGHRPGRPMVRAGLPRPAARRPVAGLGGRRDLLVHGLRGGVLPC
jgi:hypothetical protein